MLYGSLRALLSSVIDYAGLFPPASLDLRSALKNYLAYAAGDHAWALGRLVVPASRLDELRAAAAGQPVNVTLLVDANVPDDLKAAHQPGIDSIELKAATPAQIRNIAGLLPEGAQAYFEIPLAQDPRKALEAIAEAGARAKARTGGLTPDGFPGSRDLGRFIVACVDQGVAFKLTAGLHHPIRGEYPIPGDADGATALMHGFLNVFLAASFARAGMQSGEVVRLLEGQSAQAFTFDEDGVNWREEHIDMDQIVDARKNLAIAFGSCSFKEPLADLKTLKLL